jgi:hypothetical protein
MERGGSFYLSDILVRCAACSRPAPDLWIDDLGFRVVLSPLS